MPIKNYFFRILNDHKFAMECVKHYSTLNKEVKEALDALLSIND